MNGWNEHQWEAITQRGNSIVVSAAAGSGKTSVLTERVLKLIEEGEDIERMLIVTFTNLAASEMKERIYRRFQDAGKQGSARLAAQAEKCVFADISTIHAFCNTVLRDNFEHAGLSPTFTVASDPQTSLMKQRALDSAVDQAVQQSSQKAFAAKYASKANLQSIKNVILGIYTRAISTKEPMRWLDRAQENFESAGFVDVLFEAYRQMAKDAASNAAGYLTARSNIWRERGFDDQADKSELARMDMQRSVDALTKQNAVLPYIEQISVPKAKGAPNRESKTLTNRANKCFDDLMPYSSDFTATVQKEIDNTAQSAKIFIDLTRDFMKRFARAKRAKNVLDHDDTLHFALRALSVPSIARRYQEKYAHVFVDEYQDINDVQHAIIQQLLRGGNDFLVGDVKQCIYMFRESNPDLLISRCDALKDGGLIEMNVNYRSKPGVIDFINGVMHFMMTKQIGGVKYTGGQRLCAGKDGPGSVEILLADRQGQNALAAEGQMIAATIKKLVEADGFEYQDIAILRPEVSTSGKHIAKSLAQMDIPVARGFDMVDARFSEMSVFINLLHLIDGSISDVAMISVMRYGFFGFTEPELAHIRIEKNKNMTEDEDKSFYHAVKTFRQDSTLGTKVRHFFEQIEHFRALADSLVLSDFLMRLRRQAAFDEYAVTSPAAESSDSAILKFIENVSSLNITSLSDVLDIAEKVHSSNSMTQSPGDTNAVFLTTIHKSKGLEFPVVILSGMHKAINKRDASGPVLVGRELGIALDMVDEKSRVKRTTLHKQVVAQCIKAETISETVRLLYVGMTRAVEKLIISGAGDAVKPKWLESKADGWQMGATTYLDLVVPALAMWCDQSHQDIDDMIEIVASNAAGEQLADKKGMLEDLFVKASSVLPADIFAYTFASDVGVPSKVSVSALKRLREKEVFSPVTLPSKDVEISAAERGTLMHKVLQKIGLSPKTHAQVAKSIAQLAEKGIIDGAMQEHVDAQGIAAFLSSDLAGRVRCADKWLMEAPFCLRMRADEAGVAGSKQHIVVQGVIDMCFIEDGEWIVVDYKTDRVSQAGAKDAAQKYKVQLDLYGKALERITKIPVKEKYIYYLTIGEEILIT